MHPFWTNLFRPPPEDITQIAELWSKTPLFQGLSTKQCLFLAQRMHVRQYQDGERIFKVGEHGAGALLILQGSVSIHKDQTELAKLDVGDFFGETALATDDPRTASAEALGQTRLAYFLKKDLEEWIEQEPHAGARLLMNLASALSHRLHHSNLMLAKYIPDA